MPRKIAKILVALYSRTGNTKLVGQAVALALDADVEMITDVKNRSGVVGYIIAGRQALKQLPGLIRPTVLNPGDYDLVIIGSPVWAGHMSSPVRAFIDQHKSKFKQIALFCTAGGKDNEKVLAEMTELCALTPLETMVVTQKQLKSNSYKHNLIDFISAINDTIKPTPDPST